MTGDVTLCVPTLVRYDLLRLLLQSAMKGSVVPRRISIVNNGRDDEKLREARAGLGLPLVVECLPYDNLGVAGGWNWMIQHSPGPWLICNDDIVLTEHSIEKMLECPADIVIGAGFSCFLIRQRCIYIVGLFDEAISPNWGYFEDCDYMHRVRMSCMAGKHIDVQNVAADIRDAVPGDGGSQTWRSLDAAGQADHWRRFGIAQDNFVKKWGMGPVELEREDALAADRQNRAAASHAVSS